MTTGTDHQVSGEALEQFERDGYVIFRDVLDQDLINEVNGHVEWLQERHPDVRPEQLGHVFLRDDPFWVRLISDPRLLRIAELFVGPDLALFASHYISKPPYSGQPVLWHQDAAFWPLDPMQVVTLWLAVDRSTPENGCVRVIPGSHRNQVLQMRDNTAVESVLGKEIAVEVDEDRAVDMVLAPGDVEVHHPNIVHGSNANTSPHRRCGLTIRYIPTSTRITDPETPYPSAFHLQGAPGVNNYQPRPRYAEGRHYPFADSADWA
ncbi:ectoine hydroxylase-related dioxygenase (phytanoyl-CoA dioxygenase family) [Kribbella amoyensis]|uniref:Ectoine hydroxylase-related dioxygenase (Phytanoyl-CoA dioxygenase family) n=1 Tax=Kribbella amoyensis TaxID=996641 RepID=A0A561BYG9_9ACTN|nr:phytanoyl-CoA dioxygenase family protein [Kribbella amoyensis]TWD83939.1 ectoine hydroxylase-related dioxygenase (phytanoyl-CoA dioxygenase family) [Kribbella amoyensis]